MNMNIKNIIKTAIWAIIFFIFLYITVDAIYKSSSDFPDCSGYVNHGYDKITYSEITEIQKDKSYPDNVLINTQSFSSSYAQSYIAMFVPVGVISTDENYTNFQNINITKGAFNKNGVLISETLANTLFKTTDVIGEKFYLFDTEITISGIYKSGKSFLTRISSDGKEYIIVSYNLNATQNDDIDYLYIKSKTADGYFSTVDEIEINRLLDGKLNNYRKVSLTINKKIISQFKDILFFLLGLVIFVVSFKKLLKFISVLINKENNKNIVFYVKLIATTVILIIIPVIASFDLYVPANFFPADKNILNVSHYVNLFISFIQSQNISSYYFYDSLYFWSVSVFIFMIIINILLFIKVVIYIDDDVFFYSMLSA